MLISPTERAPITSLGTTSSRPEQYGADILFIVRKQQYGIQRKEVGDLIASMEDGRLAREVSLMQMLSGAMLVVEGPLRWTNEGMLLLKNRQKEVSRAQFQGLLWSIQLKGIAFSYATTKDETVEIAKLWEKWLRKEKHVSLDRRPAVESMWGTVSNRDCQRWILQSFPGWGYEIAERVVEHFGRAPIGFDVTIEELMEVEGVGRKRAEAAWRMLQNKS